MTIKNIFRDEEPMVMSMVRTIFILLTCIALSIMAGYDIYVSRLKHENTIRLEKMINNQENLFKLHSTNLNNQDTMKSNQDTIKKILRDGNK